MYPCLDLDAGRAVHGEGQVTLDVGVRERGEAQLDLLEVETRLQVLLPVSMPMPFFLFLVFLVVSVLLFLVVMMVSVLFFLVVMMVSVLFSFLPMVFFLEGERIPQSCTAHEDVDADRGIEAARGARRRGRADVTLSEGRARPKTGQPDA